MTETAVEVAAVAPAVKAPKKSKVAEKDANKLKKQPTHPPVNEMVIAALSNLKERKGSSLQAVKKYIGANYDCDVIRLYTFIRRALKTGVEKGTLIQTKGTGATGSFKLVDKKKASVEKKPKKAVSEKKEAVKKAVGNKKVKKPATKKATGVKKATAVKTGTAKKAAPSKQKSTKPSKAAAATKPKTPKPKKIAPAKKAASKKVAAKK
ncbi:histone H1 [Aedes aegypti]|uniref:Uncharacterized protein n=1 Tax=Aedes aegypti TaxID=7159 RepID=A0A6I8TUC4_AEDAE|nr:histone H1 [Aedes aegypti]